MNPPITWQRSSRCSGGHCVEVAREGSLYLIRDSKDEDQEPLVVDSRAWSEFVAGIRDGEFD